MMKTVGHFTYFMQLTIAGSDGEIGPEEYEQIANNAKASHFVSMITGIRSADGQNEQEKINEAVEYYNMHLRNGTLEHAFCACAGGIAMDVSWNMETLTAFYNSLVEIAAADGVVEHGEDRLLEFVKGEWGL